jgi:hypothetical protein
MDVIFAHNPFDYPNLKSFARFSHQLSDALRDIPFQYLVSILRYPYKVVLNLKNCMTSVSVFHATSPPMQHIVAAKADRLKPVV